MKKSRMVLHRSGKVHQGREKKKRIRRSWRVMLNNLNLSTLSENFKEKKTSTIFWLLCFPPNFNVVSFLLKTSLFFIFALWLRCTYLLAQVARLPGTDWRSGGGNLGLWMWLSLIPCSRWDSLFVQALWCITNLIHWRACRARNSERVKRN